MVNNNVLSDVGELIYYFFGPFLAPSSIQSTFSRITSALMLLGRGEDKYDPSSPQNTNPAKNYLVKELQTALFNKLTLLHTAEAKCILTPDKFAEFIYFRTEEIRRIEGIFACSD